MHQKAVANYRGLTGNEIGRVEVRAASSITNRGTALIVEIVEGHVAAGAKLLLDASAYTIKSIEGVRMVPRKPSDDAVVGLVLEEVIEPAIFPIGKLLAVVAADRPEAMRPPNAI